MSTDTTTRVRGRNIDHVRALVHELIIAKDLAHERAEEAPPLPRKRGLWNKLMPAVRAMHDPLASSPLTEAELREHPRIVAIASEMRYDARRTQAFVDAIHAALSERSLSEARLDDAIRGFLRRYPASYVPTRTRKD